MCETLRKRGPDSEVPLDSIDVREPKRFHREETDRFLDLLQLDKTLSDVDEEECALSEELVNGVMRSLEEEIAETCSTSYHLSSSGDNSAAPDISSGHEGQTRDSDSGIDLCYLLEASDDELGIPPSPVLDPNKEVCLSTKESSEGLLDNPFLQSLGGNWHFEDNFDMYQHFKLYEDTWHDSQLQDYMSRDLVNHGMLFDGDLSAPWRLETAGGI